MNTYQVNATLTVSAWVDVEADSAEEAMREAKGIAARDFEYDLGTAEVEFNVTPEVERVA